MGSFAWLALFGIGAAILVYGAYSLWRASRVRRWPATGATVVDVSIREETITSRVRHLEYLPLVRFEYSFAGQNYHGDRFTIADQDYRSNYREQAEALLGPYQRGGPVEVFVCPADPSIAVLKAEISPYRRSHYLACVAGGSLVILLSLATAVLAGR